MGKKPIAYNSLRADDLKKLIGSNLGASTTMTVNTNLNPTYKDMYKVVSYTSFKDAKTNPKTVSFHNGYFVV
jgi:hypothetical protein